MKHSSEQKPWKKIKPDFVARSRATSYRAEQLKRKADSGRFRKEHSSRKKRSEDNELLLHERAADRMSTYIKRKQRTLPQEKKQVMPSWFWPTLILAVVLLSVFLIIPEAIERSFADKGDHLQERMSDYIAEYGKDIRLINVPVATVYSEPNIKGERLTQVLYNTPVQKLIDQSGATAGFEKVNLIDGRQGYILAENLIDDRQSIEPDLYTMKIVVTDLTKRVMSHATQGNMLIEVKRGTELYVLYNGNDLFRVQLPGGVEGWLSSSGVVTLPATASLPYTDADRFTASLLAYDKCKWMEKGISNDGIDIYGVLRMTAHINGLDLPVDNEALMTAGEAVEDAVNDDGTINADVLQAGDVFFCERITSYADDGTPSIDPSNTKLAIWIQDDRFLTESTREFSITSHESDVLLENWHITGVVRFFPPSQ